MFKHTDLCSGIGGFSLGFAWAGLSEPILFCEQDAWCQRVLHKHWPDVPCYPDVRRLLDDAGRSVRCDILTAGYPCQPFSQAGRRKGDQDSRHIWPEIRDIVQTWRPTWCVFENVYGHVSMGLDTVLDEMDGAGYATKTFIIPAAGVGAAHKRDRVWIIANTDNSGQSSSEGAGQDNRDNERDNTGRFREDVADTENNGCDRRSKKTGRTGPEDLTKQSRSEVRGEPIRHGSHVADTKGQRVQGHRSGGEQELETHGQKGLLSGQGERSRPAYWKTEPAVGRVADGIPRRVDRIKGLGNAIVPQIAEVIGLAIKETLDVGNHNDIKRSVRDNDGFT